MLQKLTVSPRIVAGVVQIAGAAAVAVGVGMIDTAAGVIVGGVQAVVFGVALERGAD